MGQATGQPSTSWPTSFHPNEIPLQLQCVWCGGTNLVVFRWPSLWPLVASCGLLWPSVSPGLYGTHLPYCGDFCINLVMARMIRRIMPDLDLKRVRADVRKRQASRQNEIRTGGRPRNGTMALLRRHLAQFEQMVAEGATWVDIAAALAAQGVSQGDGQPITGRRLTALRASLRRQDERRTRAVAERTQREDIPARTSGPRPTLSGELAPPSRSRSPLTLSEEDHRRAALDRAKAILKKD